ncbi:SMC-Scp complex subunit ScpB [Candidatus Woesearchaeota archaeon]|nr:SMC-Scp complex subunit ScpB [Candidatus Woesearchaeota archaeon]
MSNLKYKIEALLFSSGRRMPLEEMEKLTKAAPEDIRESIRSLKEEYAQRNSSIHLIDEGNAWKLSVKDEHIDAISQIVTKSELPKTLMETLAVIAFKYPMKQSDLIRIRTNKAYGHLLELERLGYIARQKFSRTKLIRLTPKFFEYFDLPPEKLKEKFKDFEGIAQAITEKDQETKKVAAKQAGQGKSHEIDVLDKQGKPVPLEVYEETKQEQEFQDAKEVLPIKENLGALEVVEVEERVEPESTDAADEGIPLTEEMGEGIVEEVKELFEGGHSGETPKTTEEVDTEIDKRVDELLKPMKVSEEDVDPEDNIISEESAGPEEDASSEQNIVSGEEISSKSGNTKGEERPEEEGQSNEEELSQEEGQPKEAAESDEGDSELENAGKYQDKENPSEKDEVSERDSMRASAEDLTGQDEKSPMELKRPKKIEDLEDYEDEKIRHTEPKKGQKGLLE